MGRKGLHHRWNHGSPSERAVGRRATCLCCGLKAYRVNVLCRVTPIMPPRAPAGSKLDSPLCRWMTAWRWKPADGQWQYGWELPTCGRPEGVRWGDGPTSAPQRAKAQALVEADALEAMFEVHEEVPDEAD